MDEYIFVWMNGGLWLKIDKVNKLNGYFEELANSCKFKHWYFGSLHEDRLVTPKYTCLFNKIIPLGYIGQIDDNI